MVSKLTFFPVGNGDMTLIELESGRTVLIDVNIRAAADDEGDETPDVANMLRERLKRDAHGRLYVDAFLVSHPDKDHCNGLRVCLEIHGCAFRRRRLPPMATRIMACETSILRS